METMLLGSRVGAVLRALASHQCVPGSIPGPGVICGLNLLLVLYFAPRVENQSACIFLLGYFLKRHTNLHCT